MRFAEGRVIAGLEGGYNPGICLLVVFLLYFVIRKMFNSDNVAAGMTECAKALLGMELQPLE